VLAKSISRSIGCTFKRIQFTPDLLLDDVSGQFRNQNLGRVRRFQRLIMAQIVLTDDNRATPRRNQRCWGSMEERQMTVDGYNLHDAARSW